jgi:hypothetical protein
MGLCASLGKTTSKHKGQLQCFIRVNEYAYNTKAQKYGCHSKLGLEPRTSDLEGRRSSS